MATSLADQEKYTSASVHTLSPQEVLQNSPHVPFWKNRQLLRLYLVLTPACLLVSATNGFDGSMMNGLQSVDSWQRSFNYPEGAILGILSASYVLGAFCSTPFSSLIAEHFGRRWAVFLGSIVMIVGIILQTASQNIGMFVAARIILGLGVTVALTSAPVLITEIAHPNDRALFTALYSTTWYLGAIAASWTTYGTFRLNTSWGWRIPSALQGFPALLQLVFVMMLPESPRWLIGKDRMEEALKVLADCHANGDQNDELVQAEMYEISEALRLEKEFAKEGVKQLWATPGNRKRLFILICMGVFANWSGNGLVSYYLSKILTSIGITESKEQTLINGILSIVNYITSCLAVLCVSRVGRRKMFLMSTIGMFFTFSALTIGLAIYNEKEYDSAAKAALGFIFIYYTCYNFAFNPLLWLYPVEILPFRIRTMGLSVMVAFTKGTSFFNQFVNPIGLANIGWKYYLVYCGWLLVEIAIVFFFFPETKDLTLEAIASVFDKLDSTVQVEETCGTPENDVDSIFKTQDESILRIKTDNTLS